MRSRRGTERRRTVELESNNLNGTVPESIGQLKALQKLVLADNNVDGSIPAAIVQLREVKHGHEAEPRRSSQLGSGFLNGQAHLNINLCICALFYA